MSSTCQKPANIDQVPETRTQNSEPRTSELRTLFILKILKVILISADILLEKSKRRVGMETEDFLRVINECDFICDDIDEIKGHLDLTKSENSKMSQAVEKLEKAKQILVELFPSIKSLDVDVREDLENQLMDLD